MNARSACWMLWCAAIFTSACASTTRLPDGGALLPDGGTIKTPPIKNEDGGIAAVAPELATATAQVAGRTGLDLRIAISGSDQNLDIVGVWVRLIDAQGNAVLGFDQNRDGTFDAAESQIDLSNRKQVGESLTADAIARRLFSKLGGVAQVTVALVDSASQRSNEVTVNVSPQTIRPMGGSCDPLYLADRCADGLGCRGTPATCQEGLAPTITKFGFFKTSAAPLILIEGTEPEDDLTSLQFTFLDAQGKETSIDSDGDDVRDMSSFDYDATDLAIDGTFFVRFEAAVGLESQIAKLVATPSDKAGHTGTVKSVAPTTVPVRSAGQSCDPRGFDTCGTNLVCSPGIVGKTNTCSNANTLRANECKNAPVLVATKEGAVHLGQAEGTSFWNVPDGCQTNNPTGRPEGVVLVRLLERTNKLTLSTISPNTNFDTAIYALQGCPTDSTVNLGCSDDVMGAAAASELELKDMPAGDYLVIIDSFDFTGGTFQLTATVE